MGFYLRCAIAKVDDELAAQVETAMRAVFPPFVIVRRFAAPFAGVIAGHDPRDVPDDELAYVVEEKLPQLSHELGALPLAYVDIDCFGGTCMFDGHVIRDGSVVHREPTSASAHVRLFAHLGITAPQWHFMPFTRGFMKTGVGSDDVRMPTTFYVHARWDESFHLAATRAGMLPPPWRVTVQTERDCVVVYGEQFVASINTVDDHVELKGQSFCELTLTKTLAGELADDDIALDITNADGKPL